MNCAQCGAHDLAETVRFCPTCGHLLTPIPVGPAGPDPDGSDPGEKPGDGAAGEASCPACGHMNRAEARFCMRCGQPLAVAAAAVPEAAPDEAVVPPETGEAGTGAAQPASEVEALPQEAEEGPPAPAALLTAAPELKSAASAVPDLLTDEPDGPAATVEAGLQATPVPAQAVLKPGGPASEPAGEVEVQHEPVACPGCGGHNRAGARFCVRCGQPLITAEPAANPALGLQLDAEIEAGAGGQDERVEPAGAVEPLPEEAAAVGGAGECPEPPASAAPPLLPAGTVIQGRYRVLEVLPSPEAGANLYAIADLGRCWSCSAEVAEGEQTFCSQCGADVGQPSPEGRVHLAETLAPSRPETLPGEAIVHDGRLYVLVPRSPAPVAGPFPLGVRLSAAQASDPGKIRDLDEDSVLALTFTGLYQAKAGPSVGLYIVADGIGGEDGGEWASHLATQAIANELLRNIVLPVVTGDVLLPLLDEAVHDYLGRAVLAANEQIYRVRCSRNSEMGTTVTMALVLDDRAYIANVGDSRTYVWGQDGLEQVTVDHSLIASLIANGVAAREEIYTHPQRNAIYRSLGDKRTVDVDLFSRRLAPGNSLVLCCDGLWEMIRDEGIEELLLQNLDPQAICDEAVRRANQAGGEDNISVIVARAESNR